MKRWNFMSFVPNVASIEMAPYAPLSSLMDLTMNAKTKTMEGKGVGACFLERSTSRVEGRAGALG
jgi:hypothetical protein